jgi:carboxyl-terminal processing protease
MRSKKSNVKHNNTLRSIQLPLLIAGAMAIGVFVGTQIGKPSRAGSNIYESLYKFRQVIAHVNDFYVDPVNTEVLIDKAIESALQELDPHSLYIPFEEHQLMASQLEGNYEGIGVEFNIFRDTIVVVTPLSGGPSEKLGIRSGDKIIKVENENVAGVGIKNRGVVERLRGPADSEVNVTILRGKKEIEYTITRGEIPQYSLDVAYMLNDSTGYIKINRFAATTYMEFKEALYKLQKEGMEHLILDLTGNGGGYMKPAVKMVDEFLEDGKKIVYTKGKISQSNSTYWSEIKGDFEQGELIILVDEGSASASEIVAGAVQDHDRGIIVGRRTFGKGLVQNYWELDDGSQLRLTTSRYYTPSGRNIQKPYEAGNLDEYYREQYERYANGEMYTKDSIHVADSLVFTTTGGRKVFGGGGIIPDFFVPLDTTGSSDLLTALFNTNTLNEYSFDYVRKYESELKEMGLSDFTSKFEVSNMMWRQLKDKAETNGVDWQEDQAKRSEYRIKYYLKAYIARGVWDREGFYPVFNAENPILDRALEVLSDARNILTKGG